MPQGGTLSDGRLVHYPMAGSSSPGSTQIQVKQRHAREHRQIRHLGPAEVEPGQPYLSQWRKVCDSVAPLKAEVGQWQFRQGSQVRYRRSRNVQADGSVAVGMQALVLDPERVKPTSERPTSVRCGVPVISVTREKRGNASDIPVARVQSTSLAARVSISAQSGASATMASRKRARVAFLVWSGMARRSSDTT